MPKQREIDGTLAHQNPPLLTCAGAVNPTTDTDTYPRIAHLIGDLFLQGGPASPPEMSHVEMFARDVQSPEPEVWAGERLCSTIPRRTEASVPFHP